MFGPRVENNVAGSVDMDEVTYCAVAFRIGLDVARQRVPGAEVVPSKRTVGNDDILGVFHQGEVYGDFFNLRIFPGQELFKLRCARYLEPASTRLGHFWLMFFQTLRDCDERPDEHTRVPAVVSAIYIFDGSIVMRFLDELLGFKERGLVGLDPAGWRQRFA